MKHIISFPYLKYLRSKVCVAHVVRLQRVKISDRAAESLISRILMTHQRYVAQTLMTPRQLAKTTNNMRKCENPKQHLAELKGGAINTSQCGQQST